MTPEELPDHAPATGLFPQFGDELFWMVSTELAGLTDEQLDFESDRWGWSQWSIRRNLSHMASGDYRWLWQRWREQLFPNGLPNGDEIDRLLDSPYDRRLDENLYWELDVLLFKLRQALCFALSVLEEGGHFVTKVFRGGAEGELLTTLKRAFGSVIHVKPPASRSGSVELYLVARDFRGR